ncbi:MAG: hypothetical protein MUO80_00535 [Dehalococcoidia bacterium]|nr:hypothetical protein [Dehalococcoidia bacterium]
MTDDLVGKLDTLAREVSRVKFSPDGSKLSEFTFEASRENHTLVFRHRNIEVKVGKFEPIDAEKWAKREDYRYPATSGKFGIRYYFYEADVHWKVAKTEVKGRIALGFWGHRDKLLSGLATSRERDAIDALLSTLDKVAARLYHTGLIAPVKAEERSYPEDLAGRGARAKEF